MADLRAQLQNALGNSYTLDRERGGGGISRVVARARMIELQRRPG